jgi:hypothetical protein
MLAKYGRFSGFIHFAPARIEPGRCLGGPVRLDASRLVLGGGAADLDRGAEAMTAGFTQPGVTDAALVHEG